MAQDGTVAVVGAGDYIGGAIAKRFAREGFHVFAGRRSGEKLKPLVDDIEAVGGRCTGLDLDARDEAQVAAFIDAAEAEGRIKPGVKRMPS